MKLLEQKFKRNKIDKVQLILKNKITNGTNIFNCHENNNNNKKKKKKII